MCAVELGCCWRCFSIFERMIAWFEKCEVYPVKTELGLCVYDCSSPRESFKILKTTSCIIIEGVAKGALSHATAQGIVHEDLI